MTQLIYQTKIKTCHNLLKINKKEFQIEETYAIPKIITKRIIYKMYIFSCILT